MFYQHNMGAGGWIFMAPTAHHIASGASASEILDRRFASGEIDADKYQRLRTRDARTDAQRNATRLGKRSRSPHLSTVSSQPADRRECGLPA
jgi:hypothetical protein